MVGGATGGEPWQGTGRWCLVPCHSGLVVVFVAWSSSGRRDRLPSDWVSRRRVVLERDGGVCQWRVPGGVCGEPASDVDHVVLGDDDSFGNLRSLCSGHHSHKSSWEGASAYWAGVRESREKFREGRGGRHPGIV